jgi:hypothetical protein
MRRTLLELLRKPVNTGVAIGLLIGLAYLEFSASAQPTLPPDIAWGSSRTRQCWGKTKHAALKSPCPLFPQKRTSRSAAGMSANCQKRTFGQSRRPSGDSKLKDSSVWLAIGDQTGWH